jgi:hypothetical protein
MKQLRALPILALFLAAACGDQPTLSPSDALFAAGGTGNPHFIGQPSFTDLGTTLGVTGTIAGLGTGAVDIVVTASGTGTIECTNPGGNVAPGQTKELTVSGAQTNVTPEHGRVDFSVATTAPEAPQDACPNDQWTPSVVDVDFTSATITVTQTATGALLLEETFEL